MLATWTARNGARGALEHRPIWEYHHIGRQTKHVTRGDVTPEAGKFPCELFISLVLGLSSAGRKGGSQVPAN